MPALKTPRQTKPATKLVSSMVASVIANLCHSGIAFLQDFGFQELVPNPRMTSEL
jgi:hypothetical protein